MDSGKSLTATRQILAERGYQGLSIDAVARAAGTTRPTVYSSGPDTESKELSGM